MKQFTRVIELNQLNQVVTEEYRARNEATDAKDAKLEGRKSTVVNKRIIRRLQKIAPKAWG